MGREDTDNATDIPDTDTDPSNKKPFSKSRGHRITTVNNHERKSFSKFQLKKINRSYLHDNWKSVSLNTENFFSTT